MTFDAVEVWRLIVYTVGIAVVAGLFGHAVGTTNERERWLRKRPGRDGR
jgi:hypothetical protein